MAFILSPLRVLFFFAVLFFSFPAKAETPAPPPVAEGDITVTLLTRYGETANDDAVRACIQKRYTYRDASSPQEVLREFLRRASWNGSAVFGKARAVRLYSVTTAGRTERGVDEDYNPQAGVLRFGTAKYLPQLRKAAERPFAVKGPPYAVELFPKGDSAGVLIEWEMLGESKDADQDRVQGAARDILHRCLLGE